MTKVTMLTKARRPINLVLMIGICINMHGAYWSYPNSFMNSLATYASSFKNLIIGLPQSAKLQTTFAYMRQHPQKVGLIGLSAGLVTAVFATACWLGLKKVKNASRKKKLYKAQFLSVCKDRQQDLQQKQELQDKNALLTEELEKTKRGIGSLTQEKEQLRDHKDQLDTQLNTLTKSSSEMTEELNRLMQQCKVLQESLNGQKTIEGNAQKMEQLNREIIELQNQLILLQYEKCELEKSREAVLEQISQKDEQIVNLQRTLGSQLATAQEQLKQALKALQDTGAIHQQTLDGEKQEKERLNQQIAELQKQLEDVNLEKRKFEDQLQEKTNSIEQLTKDIKDVTKDMPKKSAIKVKLTHKIKGELKKEFTKIIGEYQRLKVVNNELEIQRDELIKSLKLLKEKAQLASQQGQSQEQPRAAIAECGAAKVISPLQVQDILSSYHGQAGKPTPSPVHVPSSQDFSAVQPIIPAANEHGSLEQQLAQALSELASLRGQYDEKMKECNEYGEIIYTLGVEDAQLKEAINDMLEQKKQTEEMLEIISHEYETFKEKIAELKSVDPLQSDGEKDNENSTSAASVPPPPPPPPPLPHGIGMATHVPTSNSPLSHPTTTVPQQITAEMLQRGQGNLHTIENCLQQSSMRLKDAMQLFTQKIEEKKVQLKHVDPEQQKKTPPPVKDLTASKLATQQLVNAVMARRKALRESLIASTAVLQSSVWV